MQSSTFSILGQDRLAAPMRPQVRQQRHASQDALVEALKLKVLIGRVVGLIGIGIRRHKGRHAQQIAELCAQ